jgi:hypothetical protein
MVTNASPKILEDSQEGMSKRSIKSYSRLDVFNSDDSPDGW